jgi:hypothetical protein
MDQIWIAAAVVAAVVLGVPFAAIVLVSIASRREEAEHSLSRQAPGAATHAARRLLGFRGDQVAPMRDWPARTTASDASPRGRGGRPGRSGPDLLGIELMPAVATALAPSRADRAAREVRFGHARRPLSAANQYPASRQSQPRSVRADQRQGAGV